MSYPITVLEKDRDIILKALRETSAWINYPEQYRRQNKEVKELEKVIELCKSKEL